MANDNVKRVRKLKKSYTWIWLIISTILIILSCILVAFLVSIYCTSFANEKIDAERSTVQTMADICENSLQGGSDPASVLAAFDRPYFILDHTTDKIVLGEKSSCGLPDEKKDVTKNRPKNLLVITAYLYDASLYPDTETPVIELVDGEVLIHFFDVLQDTDPFTVYTDKDLLSDDMVEIKDPASVIWFLKDIQHKMVRLPMWIGITMQDETSEFIAKSYITVELVEFVYFVIIIASIWILVLFGYISMMINLISGIARRRKTLKVFFTDAITQGNNQIYFLYRGEELIKKRRNCSTPYYVVNLRFIGYRNFVVGHSIKEGERVLTGIYDILKRSLLNKKELCAHTAEADFALLLRGGDEVWIRDRVNAIMESASHITDDHVFVFQSGIHVLPAVANRAERKGLDLGEIYSSACAAREAIGNEDPGIYFFDEKLVEDRRWTETVQDHQQAALDNEEFVVYYQPKYDPRTDELRGAEALIRWQSPEFGFVPPGRMIPIFEKNGFITEIDHYMISHVARDQKRWLDAGYNCVPVSVNVSRAHFIESDLAEQILHAVDAEGAPHALVEIELTESAFFDDKKALVSTIERLKSYGFAVSMDDFGSGYSSLNSLKDMPLDVLKLDAEFFRGENESDRGRIVVSEAIRLAKCLDMRTVAEGVEQRDQVDFLASQDCDMIQGYFYAKPMPAADYEVRMKERFKPKEA